MCSCRLKISTRNFVALFSVSVLFSGAPLFAQELTEPERARFVKAAREQFFGKREAGETFNAHLRYPERLPALAQLPWSNISYKDKPEDYMGAVLAYCCLGNVSVNWDVSKNKRRSWYHAPWLQHVREKMRGLRPGRRSEPRELGAAQLGVVRNWQICFYNARGAWTLGEIWRKPHAPQTDNVVFPEGTVKFRLRFTEATKTELPLLGDSPIEWTIKPNGEERTVRLAQIDFAVKDVRAKSSGGWVFGCFYFDGAKTAASSWDKFRPIGLMWGNDPEFTVSDYLKQGKLQQGWVNPRLDKKLFASREPQGELGYCGRVNGLLDSPFSSLMAAQMRALDSLGLGRGPAMRPKLSSLGLIECDSSTQKYVFNSKLIDRRATQAYFRNISTTEAFWIDFPGLDTSLETALGLNQFYNWARHSHLQAFRELQEQKSAFKALKAKCGKSLTPAKFCSTESLPARYAFSDQQVIQSRSGQLVIDGEVAHPIAVTLADLELRSQLSLNVTKKKQQIEFTGVSLSELLTEAGIPVRHLEREHFFQFLRISSSDNYHIAVAIPEMDAATFLIATRRNSERMDERRGPLRLVISGTSHRSRWVRKLARITVRRGY